MKDTKYFSALMVLEMIVLMYAVKIKKLSYSCRQILKAWPTKADSIASKTPKMSFQIKVRLLLVMTMDNEKFNLEASSRPGWRTSVSRSVHP